MRRVTRGATAFVRQHSLFKVFLDCMDSCQELRSHSFSHNKYPCLVGRAVFHIVFLATDHRTPIKIKIIIIIKRQQYAAPKACHGNHRHTSRRKPVGLHYFLWTLKNLKCRFCSTAVLFLRTLRAVSEAVASGKVIKK